jgi:hypothetical protein
MLENEIITIPQNFFYKQTTDLENVQRNKKKEKGEFTKYQGQNLSMSTMIIYNRSVMVMVLCSKGVEVMNTITNHGFSKGLTRLKCLH